MDFVSEQYFVETLALLPELVDLENEIVQVDLSAVLVATAFSTHCSELTTIEGANTRPIIQVTPGRWRHNPQGGILEMMIKSCPKLREIDWIGRTLYDTTI
ncbi:hypothetical protein BGW39_001755 [Mortierella sp. 14UC]|nr:hypothetical protein BGW39_001755 [Mortierella sp. 14UC]